MHLSKLTVRWWPRPLAVPLNRRSNERPNSLSPLLTRRICRDSFTSVSVFLASRFEESSDFVMYVGESEIVDAVRGSFLSVKGEVGDSCFVARNQVKTSGNIKNENPDENVSEDFIPHCRHSKC